MMILATSLSLTIPVNQNDTTYDVFNAMDHYLADEFKSEHIHKFIINKNDNYYVRFKLYNSTEVFVKNKKVNIHSLLHFYKILKPETKLRIVFGFTHCWSINNKTGFSPKVLRIQLNELDLDNEVLKVDLDNNFIELPKDYLMQSQVP